MLGKVMLERLQLALRSINSLVKHNYAVCSVFDIFYICVRQLCMQFLYIFELHEMH